jgi:hypothetical protein
MQQNDAPAGAETMLRLIDAPKYVTADRYDAAITEMLNVLSRQHGIAAIYQIGHVATPGISDIDLVAVFADDATCTANPRETLSPEARYLFIHNPFSATATDFAEGRSCSFFHNYVHLWGAEITGSAPGLSSDAEAVLKRQVALEYLLSMYIGMSTDRTYGVVRLRPLLLQAKGLLYDCEFLGITSGPFVDAIRRLVATREDWFQTEAGANDLREQWLTLDTELETFLRRTLERETLFLPPSPPYRFSRNVRIHAGDSLRYRRSGLRVPAQLALLGKLYLKLQRRFTRLDFEVPFESGSVPAVVRSHFARTRRLLEKNRSRFPHFLALTSSLTLE